MRGRRLMIAVAWLGLGCVLVTGCGAADGDLDPAELDVRDLLGLDPEVAAGWDARARAGARRVLSPALAAPVDGAAFATAAGREPTLGALAHAALVRVDVERERQGRPPLLVTRLEPEAADLWVHPVTAPLLLDGVADAAATAALVPGGWDERLAHLPARGARHLVELAAAAGRVEDGRMLLVQPAPRAPFAAAYVAGADLLLVNPVLLAALEPAAAERTGVVADEPAASATPPAPASAALAAVAAKGTLGNPYAFFGSLGECGAAQRGRCEACLPTATCQPETRDATDGNAECTTLSGADGRGYYLLCLNVALAIRTVSTCVENRADAATCPQVFTAGNQLAALDANAAFLDNPTCVAALDACLAELYGAPDEPFPIGPDAGPDGGGGGGPPPPAPRDVDVGCGDCSSDTTCNFDPQCDPQCESSCEGGSCGDCDRGSGSGSGGSSGGDCGSCDSAGDMMSSGGDSCSGGDCSGGDCGGSCGGDGCGSDCGSGSCGGDCSGGSESMSGSGSSCSTAGRVPTTRRAVQLVSVGWAVLPLVVLFAWRRRELRRASRAGGAA